MTATVHRDHNSGRYQRLLCTDGETEAQRSDVDTSATLFLPGGVRGAQRQPRAPNSRLGPSRLRRARSLGGPGALLGVCGCGCARARAAGARTTAVGSVRALTCRAPCWRAGGSGSGRFSLCPSRSVFRFPPPRLPSGPPSPVAGVWRSVSEGGGGRPGGRGRAPRPPGRRPREAPAARDCAAPWTSRGCRRR